MLHKKMNLNNLLLLLISVMVLSGCAPLILQEGAIEITPTSLVPVEKDGSNLPNLFVDLADFQTNLLQALSTGDTGKLEMWMTEPLLTGMWRGELADTSREDALNMLFTDQLSAETPLTPVKDADLKALMGGTDPLSIPRSEAGVEDAFLVSGWGKDGRDEAILFVARQADNSLKWLGWMVFKGGISGTHLNGLQAYTNEAIGYSLFLPSGYDVTPQTDRQVAIFAQSEGDSGGAWIAVEPANGRTAKQAVESVKADLGEGFNVTIKTVMEIEGTQALVVIGIPGQDPNRQIFMVRDDLLYHITFTPDDPLAGDAYREMEDIYAMIVNTFHFPKHLSPISLTITPGPNPLSTNDPCYATFDPLGFWPDNNHLLGVQNADNQTAAQLQVLDLDTLQVRTILEIPVGPYMMIWVWLTPERALVAIPLPDNSIQLYDLDDSQTLANLNGHTDLITAIVFAPAGDRLYSGSMDKSVRVWDMSGRQLFSFQPDGPEEGFPSEIAGLGISPDGSQLVTIPIEGWIKAWDTTDLHQLQEYQGPIFGAYNGAQAAFSPDGRYLAVGLAAGIGDVSLWHVADGKLLWRGGFNVFAFSPDSQFFAHTEILPGDELIEQVVISSVDGQDIAQNIGKPYKGMTTKTMIFSPDSKLLALARSNSEIQVWRIEKTQLLATYQATCP